MHRSLPAAAIALPLFLVGCDAGEPEAAAPPAAPPGWLLAEAPADAVGVAAAKASAAEGDTLTLTGRVGGRVDPVSPESGLIVLVDASMPTCADNPDDACTTPWDYCCEPQERVAANAATLQLRDADGQPVAFEAQRIPPMSTVTATGTVAPRPNDGVLVLHAATLSVSTP